MKNKIVILVILIMLAVVYLAGACMDNGARMFRVLIEPLEIDIAKLEELCPLKAQAHTNSKIAKISSHYDNWVNINIVIWEGYYNSLSINLPYRMNEKNQAVPVGADPKTYNWKDSVKTELLFLRNKGILNLKDEEIAEISGLARGGLNIEFCHDEWWPLSGGCMCLQGSVSCPDCGG